MIKNAKSQVFLQNILTNVPHFIFWKDTHSVYLGCNASYAGLVGLRSHEDIVGKTDHDLGWQAEGHTAEFFRQRDQEVIQGNSIINLEQNLAVPGHKLITVLMNKVPLVDKAGNILGVLGIATDITEKKQAEKELIKAKENAEVANRAKTEFLANMNHDLRTPLNGILGCAQILQNKLLDADNKELTAAIITSGKILLELMQNILDFCEQKSALPQPEPIDLRELTREIIKIFSHQAHEKNLELQINYNSPIPQHIFLDKDSIRRILVNLLGNALKFTDKGYISISVEIKKSKQTPFLLELAVCDTGIGIASDKIDSIFERFVRLELASTGRYPGSGLGLTIVKQLIDKLNGTIQVESEIGKGTSFICRIPIPETYPPS